MHDASIRDSLNRVLRSDGFARSKRSSELLVYIVETTLADPKTAISGTTIAQDVFGRGAEFDASSDPIARVQMRRVRLLLDEYYRGAGKADPVEIQIPKGGYRPHFLDRQPVGVDPEETAAPAADPLPDAAAELKTADAPDERSWLRRHRAALAATAVALAILSSAAWVLVQSTRPGTSPTAASIVIRPLVNVTGNEANEIFEVGLQRQIAADLQRFDGLKVGLKGADDVDAGERFEMQGKILNLTGSVDLLFEVFDRESDRRIWHRRVTRRARGEDYYESLSALSAAVVDEIGDPGGSLGRWLMRSDTGGGPDNRLTNETFLCLAMFGAFNERRTLERYRAARACIQSVLADSPDNAALQAADAWLFMVAVADLGRLDVPELRDTATLDGAAQKAIEAVDVDPSNARAHTILGLIENIRGNRGRALIALRRAHELNPRSASIMSHISRLEAYEGNWEEARRFYSAAFERTVNPPRWYYIPVFHDRLVNGTPQEALAVTDLGRGRTWYATVYKLAAAALAGRDDVVEELRPAMMEFMERQGSDPFAGILRQADPELLAKLTEGLRIAGVSVPSG